MFLGAIGSWGLYDDSCENRVHHARDEMNQEHGKIAQGGRREGMEKRTMCKPWTKTTMMLFMLFVILCHTITATEAPPASGDAVSAHSAIVELGGVTVFRFVEPYKGISPHERASIIYRRLWHVLDTTAPEKRIDLIDQIRVGNIKNDVCIFIGDHLIVTIDDIHPRLNHASPQELANIWADNLRRGLANYLRINAP
jgi:hypothetical protein